MATQDDKKRKKKRIILLGLGTAAAGILGYFGWQWWKQRKERKDQQGDSTASFSTSTPPSASSFLPSPAPKRNDDFPLRKGSKGAKVKALQEALLAKYGKSILPRYGADGDFGNETLAALKRVGLPESVEESTFNVLTKGNAIDPKAVALSLFKAAVSKNLNQVLFTLRGMKSTDDYSAVSQAFQLFRIAGVRKTLVNGLLDSFTDESQKQKIRLEFSRMGLKYDGSKWSLSGLNGPAIITAMPTVIWANPHTAIKVPARMVLGTRLDQRGHHTLFDHNGHRFLVETKTIQHL